MNIQLTPEQLRNLLVFLNRVNLNGNEAEILVQLKIILTKVLQSSSIANQVEEELNKPKEEGK